MPIHEEGANSAAKARLIAALRERRLIGMTGAGLSKSAGYPLWNEALLHLAARVREVTGDTQQADDLLVQNANDPLYCAQRLGALIGDAEFTNFIAREFGPNGRTPPNVLLYFALLPLRHVLTLNFDLSCEGAHTAANVPFRSLSSSSNEELAGFFREMNSDGCVKTIFHLHGRFNDPLLNIALTEVGYQRLYGTDTLFHHHFKDMVISKSVMFAGFGFTDSDIEHMFYDTARLVKKQLDNKAIHYHFAIIGVGPNGDDRSVRQRLSDRYLTDAVFYNVRDGDNPHAEFPELMRELAEACDQTIPAVLSPVEPLADVVAIEDIQRMEDMSDGFLRRIEENHEND